MNKKADMGIGTLIIFIAMIIVAATAAAVFIQTASSMQEKALSTAKASKSAVSTRMNVIHLSAVDGSNNQFKNFKADIKLIPGSDPIKLDGVLLSMMLSDNIVDLSYSNKSCQNVTDSSQDGYFTDSSLGNGTFTIEYIQKSNDYNQGYIFNGDIVRFCFSSPRHIGEDEEIEMVFSPKQGMDTSIKIISPSVITTSFVKLYG